VGAFFKVRQNKHHGKKRPTRIEHSAVLRRSPRQVKPAGISGKYYRDVVRRSLRPPELGRGRPVTEDTGQCCVLSGGRKTGCVSGGSKREERGIWLRRSSPNNQGFGSNVRAARHEREKGDNNKKNKPRSRGGWSSLGEKLCFVVSPTLLGHSS